MRDQIDAQLWNEHHHQLSEWIGGAIAGGVSRLRDRPRAASGLPVQLIATVFAAGLTALTFTASAA